MIPHLFSAASSKDGDQVFVHLDSNGIDFLIKKLEQLRKHLEKGQCEHEHFFTEEWGSYELTSTKFEAQEDENHQVHHIKVYAWTEEWMKKHGLMKN